MTAILVAFTIVAFLGVEYLRGRKQAARVRVVRRSFADSLTPEIFQRDEGVFYAPGHTWARLEPGGAVRVGIDDFAQRLLGRVERIEAAPAGADLTHGDAAFVMYQGGKSAAFAPPVEGVVAAVNEAALRDPERIRRDPFGSGWLMELEPRHLADNLRGLRVADEARRWLREEVTRFKDFVAGAMPAGALGATMQDGGLPADGLLEHCDAKAWERFESEFLAT